MNKDFKTKLIDNQFNIKGETFDWRSSKLDFTDFSEILDIEEITFKKCIFVNSVQFLNINYGHIRIVFENCLFQNKLEFKNGTFQSLLIHDESQINIINAIDLKLNSIDILDSSARVINFSRILSEFVSFKIKIENKVYSQIRIDCPLVDDFGIEIKGIIDDVRLFDFSRIDFKAENITKLNFYSGSFKKIILSPLLIEDEFSQLKIGKVGISNISQKGTIQFDDSKIEKFELLDIDALDGLYILNDTELVNTNIDHCIFSKFYCNQLKFTNNPGIVKSDVSGFVLNNVHWTNGMKLENSEDFIKIPLFYSIRKKWLKVNFKDYEEEDIIELKDHKDTYRQLKKASISNNNEIDALVFYANEMNAYWKEIRLSGGVNFEDRFLIFLNRITSNFGQSWLNPLIGLFLFHTLLFSIIVNFYYNNEFSWEAEFGNYWLFINPLHKSDEFIELGFLTFVDFFLRLVNSYFIYHLIKATRKFIRK